MLKSSQFLHISRVRSLIFVLGLLTLHRVSLGSTIAYYRFENGSAGAVASGSGSIIDSSGNGLNGTPYKSPKYSSSVPNTPFTNNLSMTFDGSGEMVGIPDYSALALTHSLTLEAYVNVAAVHTGYGQYILFRGDDRNGLDPYQIFVQNDGTDPPQVVFGIDTAAGGGTSVSATIPALGQWFEVAGTLDDSTGQMDIYINGILKAFTTTSLRPIGALDQTQSPGLGIGNVQDPNYPTVSAFDGSIDEVRISDQALLPSQLLNVPEPTLLGFCALASIMLLKRESFHARRNS